MAKKLLIKIIRIYRNNLSPLKLRSCRFYPTCSGYAEDSIRKYGVLKGLFRSSKRIFKCHPFHPGGYDPA